MLLVFTILGMYIAGWFQAGKGQGLAAGPIIIGWGLLCGCVAFIASFFMARQLTQKTIIRLNLLLLVILLAAYSITQYRYSQRKKHQSDPDLEQLQQKPNQPVNSEIQTAF